MKILLLTSFFYPDEHVGAARWNRLAKYLLNNGHELFVVSSDNGRSPETFTLCNQIIRVDSQSSLMDRLLKRVSSVKKEIKIEKERQNYSVKRKRVVVAWYVGVMNLLGKLARFPNVYWWSAPAMVKAGIDLIKNNKIDIIVGTHPFAGCLRAANTISAKTGVPWVADMRDGWSSYYFGEIQQGSILQKILILIERYYLRKAARVVSVNETLADTLQVNRSKIDVMHNVFDPEEVKIYSYNYSNDDSLVFAFAGSIHNDHCLDIFFSGLAEGLSEMKETHLIINYYGGYFDILKEKGMAAGLPGKALINNGYVGGKAQLQSELRKADLLLVFGFAGAYGNTVTTAKIFDYIESGRPVLVVGSATSELALTVGETGIGIIASNKDAVKAIVKDLLKDKPIFLARIIAGRCEDALLKYSAVEMAKTYSKMLIEVAEKNKHNQYL